MQSNNNSNEEYMEIWASIEPKVKALNRAMHRKRKSRKILFFWVTLLAIGTCWYTLESIDKKIPTLENEISRIKLKDTHRALTINEKQEEKDNTTIYSNIIDSINSTSIVSPKNNTNIVDQFDLTKELVAPNNKKIYPQYNSFPNQEINNLSPNKSNHSWVEKKPLKEKEVTNKISLKKLPILKYSFLDTRLIADTINTINDKNSITIPIVEKKWTSTLTVSNGFSYVQRRLAIKNEDPMSTITYRNSTEKTLYASHHGLTYTLKHHSNFKFTSGINYSSIREVFNFSHTILDTFFVEGVEKIITHLDGSVTEIDGNASVKRTTLNEYEYFHRYDLLEIPLIIGYDKHWGNFKMGWQAGVLTNISLGTKGKRLGIDGSQQEIEQLGYQSRITLGYYAGLSLQKNIFPNLAVSLEPAVRIYQDISSKENLISQKYKLYGLNVNLTFNL